MAALQTRGMGGVAMTRYGREKRMHARGARVRSGWLRTSCGFVQEEELRCGQEFDGDTEPPLLAAGDAPGERVADERVLRLEQSEILQQCGDAVHLPRLRHRRRRGPAPGDGAVGVAVARGGRLCARVPVRAAEGVVEDHVLSHRGGARQHVVLHAAERSRAPPG